MALEYVVGQMVPQLVGRGYKMLPKGRYFYETGEKTPEGRGKPSEADVWALGGWATGPNSFEHVWFIECKERQGREREKQWCFFPPQDNVRDLSQNAFMIDILEDRDGLHPARLAGLMSAFYPSIPVVGGGIEIFMNEKGNWAPNTESIPNAIRQAIMPIGHHLRWSLHRNFLLDYEGQQVELYLPVIITTAKLQILRKSAEWKDLSTFDEIEECFEPTPAVTSVFTTPSYVEQYWEEKTRESMRIIYNERPSIFVTAKYFTSRGKTDDVTGIKHIVAMLTTHMPTRALVIERESAHEVLSRYLEDVDAAVRTAIDS